MNQKKSQAECRYDDAIENSSSESLASGGEVELLRFRDFFG